MFLFMDYYLSIKNNEQEFFLANVFMGLFQRISPDLKKSGLISTFTLTLVPHCVFFLIPLSKNTNPGPLILLLQNIFDS